MARPASKADLAEIARARGGARLGVTPDALIADELFISVKTVAVHVSHILGKVGAATRSEAAAIAHRLGLAPAQTAATPPLVPPKGT